mgnify:CR=1 FL=1
MVFCGCFAAVGVVLYQMRACGGWCSCRGLFAFLPTICGLHVAVFGVSFYYMEKFKPGGVGAGVRFLLKKRTKKRKHENV